MPSLIEIGLLVLEKKIFKNFLSDVKDALDNMNAINQHSAHMHVFGL